MTTTWRDILDGLNRRTGSTTTRCDRCQLEYVPTPGWSRCPGCEALAGRDLRAMMEDVLMKHRQAAAARSKDLSR